MKLSVVEVTPEMASRWLSNNGMNRKVSRPHVSRLAKQMQAGRWVLNGQTISFDEDGKLLDGQHRLLAVVSSNAVVKMTVALGVTDPDAFKTYDSVQLKRGAHQIAAMMGVKNANHLTAAGRFLLAWENAATMESFAHSIKHPHSNQLTPSDVAEYTASHADEIDAGFSMIGEKIQKTVGALSTMAGLAVIFNRVDPVMSASFFEKLSKGIFTKENDPVMILRERILTRDKKESPRGWSHTLAALTIKSFNYHCQGNDLKNLRFRTEGNAPESFPSIIGSGKK